MFLIPTLLLFVSSSLFCADESDSEKVRKELEEIFGPVVAEGGTELVKTIAAGTGAVDGKTPGPPSRTGARVDVSKMLGDK